MSIDSLVCPGIVCLIVIGVLLLAAIGGCLNEDSTKVSKHLNAVGEDFARRKTEEEAKKVKAMRKESGDV